MNRWFRMASNLLRIESKTVSPNTRTVGPVRLTRNPSAVASKFAKRRPEAQENGEIFSSSPQPARSAGMNDQLTQLLERVAAGDTGAEDRLIERVYDRLRAIAGTQRRGFVSDDTLPPTVMVHEAFVRMFRSAHRGWQGREHFFATAVQVMRRIVFDHARRRGAQKRGGGWTRRSDAALARHAADADVDLPALDDALTELATLNARQAQIVELRYLVGLTVEETAEMLGLSPRTVQLEWRVARAWLHARLRDE
jgi:RNA polymerase sigma factor (TIGR02999 family)